MATSFHYEMSVNIKNLDKYKKNVDIAQQKLIEMVKEDTEEYVPAKKLALTRSAYIRNNNTELVYSTPYAGFQYGGYVMRDSLGRVFVGKGEKKPIVDYARQLIYSTSPHPKATSRWSEVSKKNNKTKWLKEVKETLKNGK